MKSPLRGKKEDSQLVIKQITCEYKCYNAKLRELRNSAHDLLRFLPMLIMHILETRTKKVEASRYKAVDGGHAIGCHIGG